MTGLLIRIFVPNWRKVEDLQVRGRYGTLAGVVGIICNVLLFAAKLIIGMLSHSVSIMADAVNNLADASSSIMTLIGFHLAKKPADIKHPYGHARFEYLSGLGVAALILIIGVQIAKDSIGKILHPEPMIFSAALVVVLLVSIATKLWLALFNRKIGKRISSTALIASATDSRNDVISTGSVLLSAIIAHVSGLQLDGYIGFLVALFIIYSGIQIARETISPLLGSTADPELVALIREETLGFHPCILGIHDLMVHDYGPGRCFASLHAEIDYKEDVVATHEVIDQIEHLFWEKHSLQLVIHYDPVVMDDEELNALKAVMMETLREKDERITAHDFRMVRGEEHANLIFDVVLPYDMEEEKENLKALLNQTAQHVNPKYQVIVTFDSQGFNQI